MIFSHVKISYFLRVFKYDFSQWPKTLYNTYVYIIKIFSEFQLAICSRRLQFAQSNLPIKIAILCDNIAMLLAREHPV